MRKKILACIAIMMGVIIPSFSASAYGPAGRPTYTNEAPADHAVFNSITNNAAIFDERDFVRIVEIRTDGKKDDYVNEVNVSGGKEYQVYIYYHNNASATYNGDEYGNRGVAVNVRLATQFPTELKKGEKGVITGKITATNTDPQAVWDEAYINATEDVSLAYKVGSAKIFNDHEVNGSVLPTSLFSAEGTFLGINELNGVIPGCDEYSGQVVYTLVATSTGEPTNPETPVDPEEPTTPEDIPEKLPDTGSAQVILAIIVVSIVLLVIAYFFYSNNKLYKIKKDILSKK